MYYLGDQTLPTPLEFTRTIIENSKENLLLSGRSARRIVNRKERFVLKFQHLTTTQVNQILSEYNLNMTRPFWVDEENFDIPETQVHIEIGNREYRTVGTYREELTLILSEVR